jgi:hypothetical protein
MKRLSQHIVEGDSANRQIEIQVLDGPTPPGMACHNYALCGFETPDGLSYFEIPFQCGPIAEVGVNGVTHEALLAILIDRLEGFQRGPFACTENATALGSLRDALYHLQGRTRARIARGVEGTHAV